MRKSLESRPQGMRGREQLVCPASPANSLGVDVVALIALRDRATGINHHLYREPGNDFGS